MIPENINIPIYFGRETSYEDIVYSYFRNLLNDRGYSFKVKRTGFPEIDNIISSFSSGTKGRGSCDGYIFSDNKYENICGMIELESTGKLSHGITQIRNYINGFTGVSLSQNEKEKIQRIEKRDIVLIAYDGQNIYFSLFNLDTNKENVIYDSVGIKGIHSEITKKIFSYFPKKGIINREGDEKRIINEIATIIRGHEKLQKNKALLMTILASIYGATIKNNLENALKELEKSQEENDVKLFETYEEFLKEIPDKNDKQKISILYEKTASRMYELSQDRGMDLYGFIYEELAAPEAKKEQGEYYTQRQIIRTLLSAVYSNYLQDSWNVNNLRDKIILDPFGGSGGFLYEYIILIKKKFELNKKQIDDIAKNSLWGFDKNNILAAYLNLSLIGDGTANLERVKTSINWREQFLYNNHPTKKYDVTKIDAIAQIKQNVKFCSQDIQNFLKMYVDKEFHFDTDDFEKYLEKSNPIDAYIIDKLGWEKENKNENYLGNVDLLLTNVPMGKVTEANEQIIENGNKIYGNTLHTNALRECIDFLKPAKLKNGKKIEEGGIAIIIVPDAILENPSDKAIRDYMITRCDILGIISLPEFTFSPYSMEKTYALIIQKIAPEEFDYNRTFNVDTFFYYSLCDGRANSENRYKTNLIHKIKINVPPNKRKEVVEFLHNDFEPCYEPFSDSEIKYASKIENAWDYSIAKHNPNWDQKRITEKWMPDGWETLDGKKWGYFPLKKIKRNEIKYTKNQSLTEKIIDFLKRFEKKKEEYLGEDNFNAFKKDFLKDSSLTPNETSVLKELDWIEETDILDKPELLLVKVEHIIDIDLNPDSKNYLGAKEKNIFIENIAKDLKEMEIITEESIIDYFRNKFTSTKLEPIRLMEEFDVIQGTQFSKNDAYLNTGKVPVYTAATNGPAYYVSENIDRKIILNGPALIWSRKGAKAGTIQISTDKKFYVSDVSGAIKPKKNIDDYNFTFLKYYISGQVKRELQSKTNNAQLNKSKLENLMIYLPSNQKEIATIIKEKLKHIMFTYPLNQSE